MMAFGTLFGDFWQLSYLMSWGPGTNHGFWNPLSVLALPWNQNAGSLCVCGRLNP